MKERNKTHEIREKDRGSEIHGDLRERERKNRERNLERGSVVSRERRDTANYKMKLIFGKACPQKGVPFCGLSEYKTPIGMSPF